MNGNPLTIDQQIRVTLASKIPVNTVDEAEAVFQWIMGPRSSIVPVSKLIEVKQ